ncbi:MAG: GAF domain-containing sensor histidine kinase [Clostridiales bacterium]|nr:GAF domain-containing sensor histidine kinase [Clostridiales bacterium]
MIDSMLNEFYDIGKSLSSEKDTLKLLEMILDSSLRLTSADAGTIYLVLEKKTGQWSFVKNGSTRGKLLKFAIAKNNSLNVGLQDFLAPVSGKSIFGFSVISGQSINIEDAYNIDSDVAYSHNRSFDESTGYVTRSILTIPMRNHDDNITGVIQLINKKSEYSEVIDYSDRKNLKKIISFNDTDERIMNSLAGQAAVALENSHLYRDMQKLLHEYKQQNSQLMYLSRKIMKAHEEERKRIAREIHDGPAQSAVNVSFKVEICRRLMENGDKEGFATEYQNLAKSVNTVVKEIRTIIYDLKPTCLENGLISAIKSHIEDFSSETDIAVEYNFSGEDSRIEYYMTSTIYRIVQEALSNVRKHSGATQVKVELFVGKETVSLNILDNGNGFDPAELKTRKIDRKTGGFGLEGIRERVELISGSLEIDSAPGFGTRLRMSIPLN